MSFFGSTPQTGGGFSSTTSNSGGGFFGGSSSTGNALLEGGTAYSELGSVSRDGGYRSADDSLSGYHFVDVSPDTEYTITANRLENDLDPGMWVFSGFNTFQDFIDSGTLSGNNFSSGTINYLADTDDDVPHPGPYSDPQAMVTSPGSGQLTVVVTNVASGSDDGGDGRFDYELSVVIPEGGLLTMEQGSSQFGDPADGGHPLFGDALESGQPIAGDDPVAGEPLVGEAAAIGSGTYGEPLDLGSSMFTLREASGVLIFDNQQHSGDGGGQPIAGRSTVDEAANVYREFEDLGYDVVATAATDGTTLAQLLEDVGAFVLPEAERGNLFPDADTVSHFVDQGANILVFGGSGASTPPSDQQLDFLNNTFGLELTGRYAASGTYPLSPDALAEFVGGPAQLGNNDGTSYLDRDSLPDDAVVIYGRESDAESVLTFIPRGEGQLVFLGWDYFDSPGQDNGWDDAFETVAELTAEIEVTGVPEPDTGSAFFGFAG